MADSKITALTALTGADAVSEDVYLMVDVSADETKKQTRAQLFLGVPEVKIDGSASGYSTGGTVTQATNRTTGVTLNAPSGQITLASVAGSATWRSFTVTNSEVSAEDTVIVNQASGTDLYMISITAVADGSFQISSATTGGTTTEQPVLNFAILTGASS